MAHNPNNAPRSQTNAVATGKPAGATALQTNVLSGASHVAGRRMGLYGCAPNREVSDGLRNWEGYPGGWSGSYYGLHGLAWEGTYDTVVGDLELRYGNFTRDQGLLGTTLHYDVRVTHREAPAQVWSRRNITADLEFDYSEGSGNEWRGGLGTYNGTFRETVCSISFSLPQQGAGAGYDPQNYNAFVGDAGAFQFTTRDLASPSKWLARSFPYTTLSEGLQPRESRGSVFPDANALEAADGAMQGRLKPDITTNTTTANWGHTVAYVNQLLSYPTDNRTTQSTTEEGGD